MKTGITDKDLVKLVKLKLYEIEATIDKEWKNFDSISLMTGLGGVAIFYAQMDKWVNSKKRLSKISKILERIFDNINKGDFVITYSSGLIGVAFMLNLLRKEGVIKGDDIDDYLLFFDNLIIEKSLEPFTNFEDIDFLHGRLGAANYFLERSTTDELLLAKIKQLFHGIADVVDNNTQMTKQVENITEFDELTHRTNCGLAHGHTSVILIFSKYLKMFPNDKKIFSSLNNSIQCLLTLQSKNANNLASFPGIAVNQKTASYNIPLGWCYGDQTIAFGISEAAEIVQSKALSKTAYEVAKRTLQRDTFETALSKSSDAGFCHGASSLAYLHKVFFQKYQDKKFMYLYQEFAKEVINKGNDLDGLAGYRKYLGDNKFENAIGLLDGIVGIGLFLLDSIMDEEKQINWQSCFLLNSLLVNKRINSH